MRSTHRITLAVALAVSAVAGTAAATQTVNLGADAKEAPPISATALAAQKAKLAAADRSIDTALTARPPALPKLPKFDPLPEPTVAPLVVTRVIPVASSSGGSGGGGGDSPDRPTVSHRSPADAAPPAASAPPAPAPAPVHVERDDDAEHRASDGEEDHPEDHGGEPSASEDHGD